MFTCNNLNHLTPNKVEALKWTTVGRRSNFCNRKSYRKDGDNKGDEQDGYK